jgi:hypothetical protein
MHGHFTALVPGAMLVAGLACMSCSDATPADSTAPTSVQTIELAVQPQRVAPEFLPTFGVCVGGRAFRTRFVVVVGSMQVVLRDLRVSFSDRFGVITIPTVLSAAAQSAATIPSSLPIPLPTTVPVPVPSGRVNNGLSSFAGSSPGLPVTLEFGCQVRPQGTIHVTVATRDDRGRTATHRLAVDVGE